MLAALARVVERATEAFDAFDYARALEIIERSFWAWTDDYLELVKGRAYEGGGARAHRPMPPCRWRSGCIFGSLPRSSRS